MPTLDGDKLVFCFRDLGENARLTIVFRFAESPQRVARLIRSTSGEGFEFATLGRVTMHLDPELPFAVLATIQGRNALSGDDRSSSLVRPQNYFATPPQRVIDGYLDRQQFHPFYACANETDNRTRLVIKVFPMKATELAWFKNESRKCGYNPRGWGTTFILESAGGCTRGPIYEDTRSLGDWNLDSGDEASIWLHQPTNTVHCQT